MKTKRQSIRTCCLRWSVCMALLMIPLASVAQITLNAKNQPIRTILRQIERQSSYKFFYNEALKGLEKSSSVNVSNATLDQTMTQVLANTELSYKAQGHTVTIIPKAATPPKGATKKISGTVIDDKGEPVIGANVSIKGTTTGTISDIDGRFFIDADQGQTLVVSYIGYTTQEIPIKKQLNLHIALSEDAQKIEEVVVVGYGTQKKLNLTGSVTSIKSDEITTTTSSSLAQSLQGKVPGLQIRQNSGAPGEFNTMINVRGFGSPLYVIDGIVRDGGADFQKLNPNDIESISILKDASAAIYGLNAGNGVVLVTTKKGNNERPKFTYNGVFGFQKPTDVVKMADGRQYMEMRNDADVNVTGNPFITKEEMAKWQSGYYPSTDWYKETMKSVATQQQHNISMRGSGGERVNFFWSLGYVNEQGILKSNAMNYEKYTFRSNITAKLSKHVTADLMVGGRYDFRKQPGGSGYFFIFKGTRTSLPTATPYANNNKEYPSQVFPDNNNPVVLADPNYVGFKDGRTFQAQSSASLTYKAPFLKGLEMKGTLAFDKNYNTNKNVKKSYYLYNYLPETDTYSSKSFANPPKISNDITDFYRMVTQAQINYKNTFGKHSVAATLAYEQAYTFSRYSWLEREYAFFTNPQVDQASIVNQLNSGNETETGSQSFIGRLNYDFLGKYLIEVAARYDGSYRYAPDRRWGFFPVVSAGWRMSEEHFIKENLTFVDNLKIRASYGTVGENAGNPFQYVPGFTISGGGLYEFDEGNYTTGAKAPGVVNPHLTWYTSNIKNVGIDLSIFKGLFSLEADIYQRDRSGLLATRAGSLPNTFGASLPQENLNSDRVQGVDLSVGHNHKIGDFHYGVKVNFNFARTKNIYVERGPFRSSYDKWRNGTEDRWKDIVWGYDMIGQFQDMEQVIQYVPQNGQGNIKELPGDYMFRDVDGNGVINEKDLLPLFWGGQPKLYYGILLNGGYKGFDLNVVLQGSGKYTVRFNELYAEPMIYNGANAPAYFHDRWHLSDPYNLDSDWVPGKWPATRMASNVGSMFKESSVWRKDASYLRCKSIELGYTIPSKVTKKAWIESARVFVNGHNLFTITDPFVRPFDPEKIEGDYSAGFNYPLTMSFNVGVDVTF